MRISKPKPMHLNTYFRLFTYLFFLPKVKADHKHRFERIELTVRRLRTAFFFLALMTAIGTAGYMARMTATLRIIYRQCAASRPRLCQT